jgi:hypothetical protein
VERGREEFDKRPTYPTILEKMLNERFLASLSRNAISPAACLRRAGRCGTGFFIMSGI